MTQEINQEEIRTNKIKRSSVLMNIGYSFITISLIIQIVYGVCTILDEPFLPVHYLQVGLFLFGSIIIMTELVDMLKLNIIEEKRRKRLLLSSFLLYLTCFVSLAAIIFAYFEYITMYYIINWGRLFYIDRSLTIFFLLLAFQGTLYFWGHIELNRILKKKIGKIKKVKAIQIISYIISGIVAVQIVATILLIIKNLILDILYTVLSGYIAITFLCLIIYLLEAITMNQILTQPFPPKETEVEETDDQEYDEEDKEMKDEEAVEEEVKIAEEDEFEIVDKEDKEKEHTKVENSQEEKG